MKRIQQLLLLCLLSACSEQPYAGYKQLDKGLCYQLRSIGDAGGKMKKGDYLSGYLSICSLQGDTLFFQPAPVTFQLLYTGGFDTVFTKFNINDSVSVIRTSQETGEQQPSSLDIFLVNGLPEAARVEFRITVRRPEEVYRQDSLSYLARGKMNEHLLLKSYLGEHGLQPSGGYRGIYYIPLRVRPEGKELKVGNTVRVEYIGRYLDGRIFDATERWTDAFIFEYGRPFQLIPGLEIALSCMKEDEEAKIILPSQLAFGEIGSVAGNVPPHTTVVYQLKLAEIY